MKLLPAVALLFFSLVVFSQQHNKANPFSLKERTVTVYATAENTDLRLKKMNTNLQFTDLKQPLETQLCVFVNPTKTFQTYLGIGGAITDASAEVFAKLTKENQQKFLNAYYDKEKGIGYSIIRTNIHSCDFSPGSYTYIADGDAALNTFNIDHDKEYRIPLIKKAIATAGGQATVYASPWSPPAFMKDTKNMLQGGKLLPEFYQAWANYYVKFIKSYEKEGIPIWGLTVQNEPMAKQTWESCIYTAEEERDFVKNFLGPSLKKAGLGNKKLTVWDHNRDLLTQRASTILDDPEASKYVWGIGFHWYESWSGGASMFDNVAKVHEMYPDKNLLFTEGCVEKFDYSKLQLWANGERYGESMIHDFNNGTVGWTDWNVLLDQNGGPNHVGNFCFSPLHGDTRTGALIFTPSYYYIGHFSKFIGKDAKRISSVSSRSSLIATSFLNQDGKVITVVMNKTDKELKYNLCVGIKATAVEIPAHAIQTLVF